MNGGGRNCPTVVEGTGLLFLGSGTGEAVILQRTAQEVVMEWLNKLFGMGARPRTALDEVKDIGGKVVVNGYRRLGAQNGCAPSSKTSDERILELYSKVGGAFQATATERGERIPARVLNHIVWKFLQVEEMLGPAMVDPHLAYELEKYAREGLRPDYQQEVSFF